MQLSLSVMARYALATTWRISATLC